MYKYKDFEKDLSKEEFETVLKQQHRKINEDPIELITRGKYKRYDVYENPNTDILR